MIRNWYMANIEILANIFGQIEYDDVSFTWVRIYRFELPQVFYQKSTSLLMITPEDNIDNHESYHFFVNKDLQRLDGIAPPFVHENDQWNNLYHLNWARLSYHLKSFRPTADVVSGDNLFGLAKAVYHFLGQEV
jgi:hypothetical protein